MGEAGGCRGGGGLWPRHRRFAGGAGLGVFAARRHIDRRRAHCRLGALMAPVVTEGRVSPVRRTSALLCRVRIEPRPQPRVAALFGPWRLTDVYERSRARDRRGLDKSP